MRVHLGTILLKAFAKANWEIARSPAFTLATVGSPTKSD